MIAVIALIVLGPSRLPEAARSIGKGMREMRSSFQGAAQYDDHPDEAAEPLPAGDRPEGGGGADEHDADDRGEGEAAGRA